MEPAERREQLFDWAWLLVFAAASSIWCVTAAGRLSATFDEPIYILRGLEHWRSGQQGGILRMGTMPLPVNVTTLPLYLWERGRGQPFDVLADLDQLLPVSRAATLLFWWLLLAYGRLVGRQLAGPWGGRVAVAALACEPSLLAHAGLATTDIALSACLLAFLYHFRSGRDATWRWRIGVPMLWFAAAVLAKVSGLVFGIMLMIVLEADRVWRRAPDDRKLSSFFLPFWRDLNWIVFGGLMAVFIYCGSDWQTEPSFVKWAHSLPDNVTGRSMAWAAEHLRIFSNAGEAIARQIKHNMHGHGVYLLGHSNPRSVWYYFPVLLTIKLTVPLLLAPLLLAILRPRVLLNWACLAAATLLVFSLNCRVQIGIRLVMPLVVLGSVGLAAAAVQAGRAAHQAWRRRLLAACGVLALLWTGTTAATAWPDGLLYVNELWGGSEEGYRLVSDSNYDWGQGVRELAHWREEQGIAELAVWYFGTDPAHKRPPLRAVPLHFMPLTQPTDAEHYVRGQCIAVSATLIYGAAVKAPHQHAQVFFRANKPVARTSTFLIYDFRDSAARGFAGARSRERD